MDNVVNIIDREFNFLAQIDNYESLILSKSYSGVGGFELHVNENTTNADKLIKENIIFTTNKKAYVILYREINSADGKLLVKGKELKSYLTRFITFPPVGQAYHRVNSNAETIIKEYVSSVLTRLSITNIEVATNQNRGSTLIYQTRYKPLSEELEKISLASGLGWDIVLDLVNKKFIFDVIEGQDRTSNQVIVPPSIFSVEYDNISEQELIDSKLNYANIAVVGGRGEGTEREIATIGDMVGLDRFEIFVDARDIESVDDLPSRGNQKLSEMQEVVTFDSRVLTDKNLIYEEDFNLGDIVTIKNKKWNVTLDTRINEVTEIYESSGFRLDITFGSNVPTILDIIKQVTNTPIVEGGSVGEQGESGTDGTDGIDGLGLNYLWSGTSLGVKREDEVTYTYVNLKGEQGYTPIKGIDYFDGEQGLKGEDGYTPIKNVDYFDGNTGSNGYTPIKGIDYFDGLPGTTSWGGITDKPTTFAPSTHSHLKSEVGLSSVLNYGLATQVEAETGTSNVKYMTPLRTTQAISKALVGVGGGGTKITTSTTEPTLVTGDQWHKEI